MPRTQRFSLIKESLVFGNVIARALRQKTGGFLDHVIDKKLDVRVDAALSYNGYIFKNVDRAAGPASGGTAILVRDNFSINLVKGSNRTSFEMSD